MKVSDTQISTKEKIRNYNPREIPLTNSEDTEKTKRSNFYFKNICYFSNFYLKQI